MLAHKEKDREDWVFSFSGLHLGGVNIDMGRFICQ